MPRSQLTIEDVCDGGVDDPAVTSLAGQMASRHEGHCCKCRDRGLVTTTAAEPAITSLLGCKPGETTIHGGVDPLPLVPSKPVVPSRDVGVRAVVKCGPHG